MATQAVQTVTGPVDAGELGRTLVHEHIVITYPGEEYDPGFEGSGRNRRASRRQDRGAARRRFSTFVDPCPIELGRDPELYAEVSQRSGIQVVCTTGFYTEHSRHGLALLLARP